MWPLEKRITARKYIYTGDLPAESKVKTLYLWFIWKDGTSMLLDQKSSNIIDKFISCLGP